MHVFTTRITPTLILLLLLHLFTPATTHGVPLVVSPGLNISTNPNITAHLPSCTNLTTAPTIPCYTTLNTTSYLLNYNLTRAEVCAPTESWSKCLLQSVYVVAGASCVPRGLGVEECQPFDCGSLNSTTCVQPKTSKRPRISTYDAAAWYAVWNVWAVHHHFYVWATALNKTSSERAILSAVDPTVANTATSVLRTVIKRFGVNANVDAEVLKVLGNGTTEETYGNARGRGEESTLSGVQWRGLVVQRLGEVSERVNFGFDEWLGMVKGGAFSTRGLSGVGALTSRLKM